jgi:hypothetical protein
MKPDVNSLVSRFFVPDSCRIRMPPNGRSMQIMMIDDAIHGTRSEQAVYDLITAYLETLQFSGRLPARVIALPIAGRRDIERRLEELLTELEEAPPRSPKIEDILEAVNAFEATAKQLRHLLDHDPVADAVGDSCLHITARQSAAGRAVPGRTPGHK